MLKPRSLLVIGSILSAPALALAADVAPEPHHPMTKATIKLIALNVALLLAIAVAGISALIRKRSPPPPKDPRDG